MRLQLQQTKNLLVETMKVKAISIKALQQTEISAGGVEDGRKNAVIVEWGAVPGAHKFVSSNAEFLVSKTHVMDIYFSCFLQQWSFMQYSRFQQLQNEIYFFTTK